MPLIDAVISARDAAPTVASVVVATRRCRHVRNVIVVDDGSADLTAQRAEEAGAVVIRRHGSSGAKTLAMQAGVAASDAGAFLFVAADSVGLTSAHLDAVCEPFLDGRATMSLGTFDHGMWNRLVLLFPPITGERILPRWVFDAIPPSKLDGSTIEAVLNEVIIEGRLPSSVRVMRGVTRRTRRETFGMLEGSRRTWRMARQLVGLVRNVRVRTYWLYLRDLTVER